MEKKYHTVGTVPKSNRQIVERWKIDAPIHWHLKPFQAITKNNEKQKPVGTNPKI
jgi:hypothetical protein